MSPFYCASLTDFSAPKRSASLPTILLMGEVVKWANTTNERFDKAAKFKIALATKDTC